MCDQFRDELWLEEQVALDEDHVLVVGQAFQRERKRDDVVGGCVAFVVHEADRNIRVSGRHEVRNVITSVPGDDCDRGDACLQQPVERSSEDGVPPISRRAL